MTNIWRDVKGYEGIYIVSDLGQVRRVDIKPYRELKGTIDFCGYRVLSLCVNSKVKKKKLHRIVAEAFLDNEENKPQVNHLDGDKLNNKVSNLAWATAKENNLHAVENRLVHKDRSNPNLKGLKINLETLKSLREDYLKGYKYSTLSSKYKIHESHVWRLIKDLTHER